MPAGDLVAKDAIRADDLCAEASVPLSVIDDEEMVAELVEPVGVAPRLPCARIGHRRHLLVEDAVAERLRTAHLERICGKPDLEVAEPAEREAAPWGRPGKHVRLDEARQRPVGPGLRSSV